MPVKSFKNVLGILLLFALSGCATISGGRHYVYVDSVPPGAEISTNEQGLLGKTPRLIALPYQRNYELSLSYGEQKKIVPLESEYRWDQFFGNFWFLSYAPIGWITDIVTGKAYAPLDPKTVQFRPQKKKSPTQQFNRDKILIVPPMAPTYRLADEAGEFWQKKLPRLYSNLETVPYQESLDDLLQAGFENQSSVEDLQTRRRLLYRFDANEFFFSQVDDDGVSNQTSGFRQNAQGASLGQTSKFSISGNQEPDLESQSRSIPSSRSWSARNYGWLKLVPNTFSLELSSSYVTLSELDSNGNEISHEGKRIADRSFYGTALGYLESLSLSYLRVPRLDRSLRRFWQFTPAAKLSYHRSFFPDYDALALVEFQFFRVGAGMGPEIVWQWGRRSVYINLIPLISYTQIQWDQPRANQERVSAASLDMQLEFGYLYFFNENVSVRLYAKSIGARTELWQTAVQRLNPTAFPPQSANESVSGIAFAYTFDITRLKDSSPREKVGSQPE